MRFTVDKELIRTIINLAVVIEARDTYTGGHVWRVSEYAKKLAEKKGFNESEIFAIGLGGLIHDIGKVSIGDVILTKPDKLSDDEYTIMKQHATIGDTLVKENPIYPVIKEAVLNHHERVDGKGYPNKASAENFGIIGRMIAIVDAFDAMTSTRPYRKAMSKEKAMSILIEEKNKQFDADLVDLFIELCHSGEIDSIIGHSSENMEMVECPGCGPIITIDETLKTGDQVTCPTCYGVLNAIKDHDHFSFEFSGKRVPTATKIDLKTSEDFLKSMPDEIEFNFEHIELSEAN